jgi:putative oxidoreductase
LPSNEATRGRPAPRRNSPVLRQWAPLPLRLIIGYGFFAHGLAKLDKGPEHFVDIVQAIGVPFPWLMAWLTILVELVCGLLMLGGALVPLISVPMLAVLVVALATLHVQFGFTSIKLMAMTPSGPKFGPPGMETDLLYIAGIAALVMGGPGPLALDGWLKRRKGGDPQHARRQRPSADRVIGFDWPLPTTAAVSRRRSPTSEVP